MPENAGKVKYHYEQCFNPPSPFSCIDLYRIGTSHFQPHTSVPLHTHVGFFELTAISAGRGRIHANNVTVEVEKGDIFVSFPYDTHSIEADPHEGMNYHFFAFYLKDEELLSDMEKLSVLYGKPTERIIHSDTVSGLLISAIAEIGQERLHHKRYLDSLFMQLIIQVIRSFHKQSDAPATPGKREELCYQVMDYINAHIFSITSLSEVAKRFSYDYTYISKIFSQTTSQSISEYYRFQRLEVARALIHENSMKLSEIAEKLGYASIYSFSKAFKKQYAVSPREYKRLYLTEAKETAKNGSLVPKPL